MSKRKCRYCGERKDKEEMLILNLNAFCNQQCAYGYAVKNSGKARAKEERRKAKEARAELRAQKERIKTKGEWAKEAQTQFNRFIRLRDKNRRCISCQRHHQGQYHAGHYRTVGANPELRFDESNCHKQCAPCNNHLSGNITNYRINLIKRIGQAEVDRIEGFNELKRYTVEDLKEIKQKYKKLSDNLEKGGYDVIQSYNDSMERRA